jgi:hypothetical protein
MKQTAVEFLLNKLNNYDSKMIELFNKEIEQAKELEKQQQGYSEEEMQSTWEDGRNGETECIGSYPFYKTVFKNKTFKEWFEQFKKK